MNALFMALLSTSRSGSSGAVVPTFTEVFADDFAAAAGGGTPLNDMAGWDVQEAGLIAYPFGVISNAGTSSTARGYVTASIGADQYVHFGINYGEASGSSAWIGAGLRMQTGNSGNYRVTWNNTTNALIFSSVSTTGDITNITVTREYDVGDEIRAWITGVGAAIRIFVQENTGSGWVNVSEMYNVAPADQHASGPTGIIGRGAQVSGDAFLINFKTGTVS